MSDEVARLGVGIVGDDRTDAAWKSAEKRAKQAQKRVGDTNRKAINDNERATFRSSRAIIGSMAKVEKATSRAFGSRAVSSMLGGRMGALSEAASALGEGFAGASLAGSGLAATAGAVTLAVGATVAVVGVAAYAAMKFGESWAKGAAQLSRTAEVIGVSTKALTEFSNAAERAGVDKGTAVGTMGSLSQTLNDARYGRNTQALEVMRRLGVGMKLNKDGTVDTAGMLPAIADALQRQNSSGRRTAARALGIPETALPAFTQGGKALAADMKDSDKTSNVIDDAAGQKARAADRKRVLREQSWDAAKAEAGKRTSDMMSGHVADAVVSASKALNEAVHGDFKASSKRLSESSASLDKASETFARKIWKVTDPLLGHTAALGQTAKIWGSGSSPSFQGAKAKQAASVLEFFMRKGWSKAAASGITANLLAESNFNHKAVGDGGKALGMAQWHPDRQANFKKVFGHDMTSATAQENLEFAHWELTHTEKAAGAALRRAQTAQEAGEIVSRMYERPKEADYEAAKRGDLATAIEATPIKVEIEVKQGKVTSVKSTTGTGSKAAVSRALVN